MTLFSGCIRHNYLNDLPSLDPELYRHLIFLKVIAPLWLSFPGIYIIEKTTKINLRVLVITGLARFFANKITA